MGFRALPVMKPGTIVTNGHLKMTVIAHHKGYVWCEVTSNNHHRSELLTFRLGTVRRVNNSR